MPPLAIDIDAFCNYSVVAIVGMISAMFATMAPVPGPLKWHVWIVPSSWLVFLGYSAAPIIVFWLFDATGVSPDTSFITAVVVAVSAKQILGGSDPKLQVPTSVNDWWQRFLRFSDTTTGPVHERNARDRRIFNEKIDAHFVRDEAAYKALLDYVRSTVPDMTIINGQLQAIEARGAAVPPLAPAIIRRMKGRCLLNQLSAEEDIERKLKDQRVIPRWLYYWYLKPLRPVLVLLVVLALVLASAKVAVTRFLPGDWTSSYSLQRLAKSTTTAADQYRAWRRLDRALTSKDSGPSVRLKVVALLQAPGLSLARADLMIGLLLHSASTEGGSRSEVGRELVLGLRSASPDVPAHVQEGLVHLANLEPKRDPVDWKPLKDTSVAEVERVVKQWLAVWACPDDSDPGPDAERRRKTCKGNFGQPK